MGLFRYQVSFIFKWTELKLKRFIEGASVAYKVYINGSLSMIKGYKEKVKIHDGHGLSINLIMGSVHL